MQNAQPVLHIARYTVVVLLHLPEMKSESRHWANIEIGGGP